MLKVTHPDISRAERTGYAKVIPREVEQAAEQYNACIDKQFELQGKRDRITEELDEQIEESERLADILVDYGYCVNRGYRLT